MSTRIAYLLVIISLRSYYCVAQSPEWIRNAEASTDNGTTESKSIAVHPDGSIFVLGQYTGKSTIGGQPLNVFANSINDGFLSKYNAQGDLIWIKQLFQSTGYFANRVLDLKIDYEGNLIFSGTCLTQTKILTSPTFNIGYFIAKIDRDANLLWTNFLPPTGGSFADSDVARRGHRIGFDADHTIFLLTDLINESTLTGGLAVVKFKPDGTKLNTIFLTNNPEYQHPNLQDFSVDKNGNFVISGNFEFRINFVGGALLSNIGGFNVNPGQFFIAKFNSAGQFQWVVSSKYTSCRVTAHAVDEDGNVYAGLQLGAGSIINTPKGGVDISSDQRPLVKITAEGEVEWINTLSLNNLEDIFPAPDGLLYVTGEFFRERFQYQSYTRMRPPDNPAPGAYPTIALTASYVLKVNHDGNFLGVLTGEAVDDVTTLYGPSVDAKQSIVDERGNVYTTGGFFEGQIWGCVNAVTSNYSFFLIKHPPAEVKLHTLTGPAAVCDGTPITLTTDLISNGALYKWFIPGNVSTEPGTPLKNSITITAKAEYNNQPVVVTISDNCNEYFTQPFVLHVPAPPKQPVFKLSKDNVCPGATESYQLTEVEHDATYTWTLPTGITSPGLINSGGALTFAPDFKAGELKITAANFCGLSELRLRVSTFAVPARPVLSGDAIVCPGVIQIQKSISAVADAVSYLWQLPAGVTFNPSFSQTGTTLNATIGTEFQRGEIKVSAVGRCKNSDASSPIVIGRFANPDGATALSGAATICIGTTMLKYAIPAIANATKYEWNIPAIFDLNGSVTTIEPFINVRAVNAGTGAITVSGVNDCKVAGGKTSLDVTTLQPLPKPKITLGECDREVIITNADRYSWFVNGVMLSNQNDKRVILSDSGLYRIETQNFCGVQKSNEIQAYPVLLSNMLVPNVITPNGDGKNDRFVIDKSVKNPDLHVVNRWGGLIYSSPSYQNNWSADDVSPGVYFVSLKHQCLPHGYTGSLSVIK